MEETYYTSIIGVGFCDCVEKQRLVPKISHGDRYTKLSRDWDEIDCKATGCKYNRYEKCMVPSRCKIEADGKCKGFESSLKDVVMKVDGD